MTLSRCHCLQPRVRCGRDFAAICFDSSSRRQIDWQPLLLSIAKVQRHSCPTQQLMCAHVLALRAAPGSTATCGAAAALRTQPLQAEVTLHQLQLAVQGCCCPGEQSRGH